MSKKKLVVIGAVAAGTKAASKAKRENPDLDVTVITREADVSYSGCGLPYFLSGIVKERKDLIIRTPQEFKLEQNIPIRINTEATNIDPKSKTVSVKDLKNQKEEILTYDYLVIATGASPFKPPIEGINLENIHTLRNVNDAVAIRKLLEDSEVNDVVVVGGGFIGLEVAENLYHRGLRPTIVEGAPNILPGYDEEMSLKVTKYLQNKGIKVKTNTKVLGFIGDNDRVTGVRLQDEILPAQLVVWAGGVKPNVNLASEAGIALGPTGAIQVNEYSQTNIPEIYAVGDCAENYHLLTGMPVWFPMGSTANKTGRIAGANIALEQNIEALPGVLGTAIIKLFDMNAARTGLTEKEAREKGFDVAVAWVPTHDKAHLMPDHGDIITKIIVDKSTRKVLGAQIVGEGVVDKPIDILVTAISLGATVDQLAQLDLAYAPPFSLAMGSTIVTANVIQNKLKEKFEGLTYQEFHQRRQEKPETLVLDVRSEEEYAANNIPNCENVPLAYMRLEAPDLDPNEPTIVVCKLGKRAYLTYKILKEHDFKDVCILEGGLDVYPYCDTLECKCKG